jgi:hypothetical protein
MQILDKIAQEKSLTQQKLCCIKNTLAMRKGKSKKDITTYILSNPCFKMYSTSFIKKLDLSKFDSQASLMVQDFLVSPQK